MDKLISIVLACILLAAGTGFSRPVETDFENNDDALILAQAMVAEADWNTADHVAIAFVLTKRYNIWKKNRELEPHQTFGWFVQRYCSLFKVNSRRAKRIRALPWGNPIIFPSNVSRQRYSQEWKKVRLTVKKFYSKFYKDPCPSALHWGGTMDSPENIVNPRASKWVPVDCGNTQNIFYRPRY